MAQGAKLFGHLPVLALGGQVDWLNHVIKLMLCGDSYTPDQDNHQFKSQVTGEIVGTGYTAGGLTVVNKTIAYNPTSNLTTLDADDVTWSPSTISNARWGVLYDANSSSDTSKPLIGLVDFDGDLNSTAGPLTVQWNTSGIATFTVN